MLDITKIKNLAQVLVHSICSFNLKSQLCIKLKNKILAYNYHTPIQLMSIWLLFLFSNFSFISQLQMSSNIKPPRETCFE